MHTIGSSSVTAELSGSFAERDAAQDAAARALARDVRRGGEGGGAMEDDESDGEAISDDDGDDDDGGAGAPSGGGGGTSAPSDETAAAAEEAMFASLEGYKVGELRERLRSLGEAPLATVRVADLPARTPTSGPEKAAAVLLVLQRRVARVLAQRAAA